MEFWLLLISASIESLKALTAVFEQTESGYATCHRWCHPSLKRMKDKALSTNPQVGKVGVNWPDLFQTAAAGTVDAIVLLANQGIWRIPHLMRIFVEFPTRSPGKKSKRLEERLISSTFGVPMLKFRALLMIWKSIPERNSEELHSLGELN